MKTTYSKILNYLGCFESGDQVLVANFVEAYGLEETRKALFTLRLEDKIRLIAVGVPARFCAENGCDRENLIDGESEVFGLVEVM